jgi:hypothetical protein
MLILQTEDDNILYIYCPSECIYNDNESRFYCYKENIMKREFLKIDYVDYHIESNLVITCDGVAHFIQYGNDENAWCGSRGYNNKKLYMDALRKAGGYWHYYNDADIVETDRKKRQWSDFVSTVSDMIKEG